MSSIGTGVSENITHPIHSVGCGRYYGCMKWSYLLLVIYLMMLLDTLISSVVWFVNFFFFN